MTTIQLNTEQCSQLKFPIGCPIWYNFPPRNDNAEKAASSFVLKRGVVQGALLRGNQLFYQVAYIDKNGKSMVEEVEDGTFGFGASCPVTILPVAADGRSDDSLGLDGEIVLCTPSATDRNAFVYTALVFLDGASKFRYEGGIEEKRIVYRKVDSIAEKKNSRITAAVTKREDADAASSQQNAANSAKNSAKASTRQSDGSYEEGEVIEAMPMEAASARNHFVPSSITTTTRTAPGGTNVSLSATESFGSKNTSSNASAADSSCQSHTKKPRYLSEYYSSMSMKSNANEIKIAIPLWLQKDCQSQRNLFFHLLGSGGCNTKRIEYESRCKVCINVKLGEEDEKNIKVPMTIHVVALNTSTALTDLVTARQMIQSLLLQFVGNDGCRGRLLYEVAQSCLGPHRPNESTSNAVKDINPFHPSIDHGGGQESIMCVVDLPSNFGHTAYLLSKEILYRIKAANASIRIVATEFKIPTKLCDPYVFVVGKSYQSVDRAVDVVQEAIRSRSHEDNGRRAPPRLYHTLVE